MGDLVGLLLYATSLLQMEKYIVGVSNGQGDKKKILHEI